MPFNTKIDEALAQVQAKRGNKWKYAFKHGILFWGLPGGLLFTVIQFYFHHIERPLEYAVVVFPVWCVGGFLFGLWRWRFGLWPLRLSATIYKQIHRDK